MTSAAKRLLRWAALGLALSAVLGVTAWLVLQWAILPRIEYWRPDVERRAAQALGVPVRIGAIEVTDAGSVWRWARAFELRDVVLYRNASGPTFEASDEALRLPSVRAAISPASFLPGWDGHWRLRFEQLLIEAPQLDVRRERDGRVLVAGLSANPSGADDGAGADWFFSQPEFAIRGGRVTWTDALRDAPPLVLDAVDLVVRNGVRRHAVRLDATPPAALGARFSLRGQFTQALIGELGRPGAGGSLLSRPGDWRRWRGTVYAELPAADIEPLRRHVDLPFYVTHGHGALRVWADIRRATAVGATLDVKLHEVALRPQPDAQPLAFAHIDGRVSVQLLEGGRFSARFGEPVGGELRAQGFGFTTADGVVWPASDFGLDWRLGADGAWAGGVLTAPRVDLRLLADMAARVPVPWLGSALREQLADLAPVGIATAVAARWDGALPAPHHYNVKGSVSGLSLSAKAAAPSPATPAAQAASDGAASSPMPIHIGRPGVSGADVDFNASEAGGEATVSLRDGAMEFPGVFEQARVPLDRLDGVFAWRIDPERPGAPAGMEVRAREVRFANEDAQGEFEGRWSHASAAAAPGSAASAAPSAKTATPGGPGAIELTGRLDRAEATRVARYLPLGVPAPVRQYVGRAVQGGQASAVNFKVKGELRDFPFGPKGGGPVRPGEFRIAARLDKVQFAYLPGDPPPETGATVAEAPPAVGRSPQRPWPGFTEVQGDLIFDRQTMELRNLQGRLGSVGSGGFEFKQIRGGIRNLSHEATLAIEGSGRGPLGDVIAFAAATPVGGWIGGALQQATIPAGAGRAAPVELQLALDIPLHHAAQTSVRGSAVLAGNDLRLRPELPPFGNARARMAFTERSFTLSGGAARLVGGEATFEGGTQADGSLRFTSQGTATAEGLRASDLPVLSRPALGLSGQAGYRVVVGFARGQPEWQVSSNLTGMAIDLPAPLRKSAEQALPLRVQAGAAPSGSGTNANPSSPPGTPGSGSGSTTRELLRVDIGPDAARVFQAGWLRESSPQGSRVLRGAIGVQDAMPLMQEGVAAQLAAERLDVDAWRRAIERLGQPPGQAEKKEGEPTTGERRTVASAVGTLPAPSEVDGYLPTTIGLRVQELDVAGRRLNRVVAAVTRGSGAEDGLWRANVEATELKGSIEYRAAGVSGGGPAGRVQARLARLLLPRQEADAVSTMLDQASPTTLPALDITVDELELHGKRLGRFEIDAVNRPPESGTGPGEWNVNKFRIVTPDVRLSAFGTWGAADVGHRAVPDGSNGSARRRAAVDFRLDIADGGALLARLGQNGVLRGAKGQLSGRVSWLGSPLAIDYPSLGGKLRLEVESGQFLKADPGIAKLLSVLSLQALPRRLLLDFRDVFAEGFAFDTVDGDVDIAQGVASTRNLRMKGVQATVLMEGSADVERETQDLRVWVVPEINAGAASLAVAVINPAVGIGSFLAQLFLRKPLIEAGTREFHVTGAWGEPQVDRIERTRTEPPAEAAAPPPNVTKEAR